ncbi:MAG: hypothetical protein JWN48_2290 [Myxococcaceae bacterium]|nr:hypothetical protein [Myxococcaceae bacterium]
MIKFCPMLGNYERELSSVLAAATGLRAVDDGLWSAASTAQSAFSAAAHDGCFETEPDSFWFEHRNRCIVELVRRYRPAGAILDVGGGNGYVTQGLREAGFDALVLEPGAGGARNALRRGLAPVVHATLEAAAFRPCSIAAIGLFDVIEHIAAVGSFLAHAAELLRPLGRLYLTVPAYDFLWSSEDVAAGHQRRYTRESLRQVLEQSGFVVDFDSYFFVPLPIPIFLLRKLPEQLGMKRSAGIVSTEHAAGSRRLRRIISAALSLERTMICRGLSMPCGASVLVAATKRQVS